MRFCFIIEEKYHNEPMPLVIADQLMQWGHEVEVLEPQAMITYLWDLTKQNYDAIVLKTVTDGPGLSILEAAEAIGIPTINNSRAVRLVRDKTVAAVYAHAHGLPVPPTYFAANPRLLTQIPSEDYPIVVKPSNGSSCKDIYLLNSPGDLATLNIPVEEENYFLAQRYMENTGFDIKLYVTGKEVYAVAKNSPLHGGIQERLIAVTPELSKLARRVGQLFGLVIFGVDVLQTSQGLVIVDINDFPSFGLVPRAVARVSEYVLHAAKEAEMEKDARLARAARRRAIRADHTQLIDLGEVQARQRRAI